MSKTRHLPWSLARLALAFAVLSVVNQPVTAQSYASVTPATTSAGRISPEQAMAAAVGSSTSVETVGDAQPNLINQRLSDMGGDVRFDAVSPAVAYDIIDNQYLVVWRGDDNTDPLVDGEYEIFGRRIDAVTGQPLGADLRLSDMGPDGNTNYGASTPAVAYSPFGEYLVVWTGDDNTGALVNDEFEIYGQRVEATTGDEIGGDFRLSDMGPDGNANFDAADPAVAYNSTSNQYLVAWRGDDDSGSLVDEQFEIYSQQVDGNTGAELGPDNRQSFSGPDGNTHYDANEPAVASTYPGSEYLLVWRADTTYPGLADNEFEIYGQRVNALTGQSTGGTRRFSDMGPDGNANYGAFDPAVAYNRVNGEYLLVWSGDDNTLPLVEGEFEIFGQRVNAVNGNEIGIDFRLSDLGPDGSPNYGASAGSVAYFQQRNEYLVAWQGDDNTGGLTDDEYEIFGQRLNAATGAELGGDLRLSDMGPTGQVGFGAFAPAVAFSDGTNSYLVAWSGDDDTGPLVDEEYEIFSQRVFAYTGEEWGTDQRQSDMGGDDLFDAGPIFGDFGDQYIGFESAVVYNPANHEYLVVWAGDDNTGALVDGELEIYGQRVDAATGQEIGGDLRLSHMGPDGNTDFSAFAPAVAYNSANNEYLVVWFGDIYIGALADYEIYGQRLAGASGLPIGSRFTLSDMGPPGDTDFAALDPAVAYNPAHNEYLVVWRGDDSSGGLVDDEYEIFGQLVTGATGQEIGADYRLSDMGPDGNAAYGAFEPAVAYDSDDHQYLVVWSGDDNTAPAVDNEFEIFGQRVAGATGQELGGDFRLSHMGPDGDQSGAYTASSPALAYNDANNEYLVAWHGSHSAGESVAFELEIFGQRVAAFSGQAIGGNLRLSHMGPVGSVDYVALTPKVVHNRTNNEYLVTWEGNDTFGGGYAATEYRIFGQQFAGATALAIGGSFPVSAPGPGAAGAYDTSNPAVAYNLANNEYLVVWRGDDNTGGLVDEEFEIFGQRLSAVSPVYLPVIRR